MKPELYDQTEILKSLDDLLEIMQFITYESFGLDKKKLIKKVKKIRKHVRDSKLDDIVEPEFLEYLENI